MKLIEPSVEIWKQEPGIEGMYEHIERCARVCYKSENKGNVTSEQFVKSLIKRKHFRPLEFGTLVLNEGHCNTFFDRMIDGKVVTNFRRFVEYYPSSWEERLSSVSFDNVNDYRPTIHWNISRGIADEFRTHVSISSLMESTRYVNYKNKGLEFVKPYWFDNFNKPCDKNGYREDGTTDMFDSRDFIDFLDSCEKTYLCAIIAGAKPQEAREILPLCIATNLVQCSFEDNWKNFFNQRCNIDAHPDAQLIANKAKELLKF